MKTIDEVIKAYEICIGYYCSNSEHDVCPYIGVSDMGCGKEPEKDALHYLKEYRDDKDEIDSTRLAYLDILTDYVALKNYWAEQQENKPLDWEELMQMEGKPVWVEDALGKGEWYIIECFTTSRKVIVHDRWADSLLLDKFEIGDVWQAYRKERQ